MIYLLKVKLLMEFGEDPSDIKKTPFTPAQLFTLLKPLDAGGLPSGECRSEFSAFCSRAPIQTQI